MFSFRRKGKKEDATPQIHASPSLPQLYSQGIPWPENLVDVAAIRQAPPDLAQQQGAAKTSFQGVDRAPIPFHKPFRGPPGKPVDGTISSLYMSNPPSAFENKRFTTISTASRQGHRRTRVPPTFNLMVVGGQGTGKTSLLRLLLETADLSPTATADQQVAVDRFLRGSAKHTQSIQTACVEICESRYERLLFSIIDTPGLDFLDGHELKLERQVNGIIKYVDAQYADTMSEESKVIRQSKGDQHIHLCIYMIDPSSIMSIAARRARSSLPTKTRSETTISYHQPPDLVPDNSSIDDSDDESPSPLTMSPAEIRVIRRLCQRCNVLPVIARADSLTDEKLLAVKDAVRRSLLEADLDFGVFGPMAAKAEATPRPSFTQSEGGHDHSVEENGTAVSNGIETHSDPGEDEDGRESRSVIKLRSSRHSRNTSRSCSRSRRDLADAARDDRRAASPDANDTESLAHVRFSAHIVAKTDLSMLMPFAFIAPEGGKRRKFAVSSPQTPVTTSEIDHGSIKDEMKSPMSTRHLLPYLNGPPEDLKGVFTRNFRWGTVDVLNPNHCDFAALRTTVLTTHLKILKMHTKEVLYENYRTQKLLARHATRHISDDERKRLLEDLGL